MLLSATFRPCAVTSHSPTQKSNCLYAGKDSQGAGAACAHNAGGATRQTIIGMSPLITLLMLPPADIFLHRGPHYIGTADVHARMARDGSLSKSADPKYEDVRGPRNKDFRSSLRSPVLITCSTDLAGTSMSAGAVNARAIYDRP